MGRYGKLARKQAQREGLIDDLGYLKVVAPSSLGKALHDTVAILHVAILTHLPLALKPRNGEAEPYDAAQHDLDEGLERGGCAARRPTEVCIRLATAK
jgi:hypothetical protein